MNYKKEISLMFSFVIMVSFLLATYYTFTANQIYFRQDLRNRIVASRILDHTPSTSPYFHKWKSSEGDYYLDPYDTPDLIMNRNTVTPFVLQIMQSFSHVRYDILTTRWSIGEVITLCLIALIFILFTDSWPDRLYIFGISFGLIGCSQAWLLHNLAGQIYIYFALFISVLYLLSQKNNFYSNLFTGILLAAFVLIRPNLVIFIIPFIFPFRPVVIGSFIVALVVYFTAMNASAMLWLWKDYFSAMNLWYHELCKPDITRTYQQIFTIHKLEGLNHIDRSASLDFLEDTSIVGLVCRSLAIKLSKLYLLFIGFMSFFLIIRFFYKRIISFDLKKIFILAFIFYFISELTIPAIRNSYNAVQWIFPLILISDFVNKSFMMKFSLLCGFVFAAGLLKFLPYDLFISEIIFLTVCVMYLFNQHK